jgi:hypothetical protein
MEINLSELAKLINETNQNIEINLNYKDFVLPGYVVFREKSVTVVFSSDSNVVDLKTGKIDAQVSTDGPTNACFLMNIDKKKRARTSRIGIISKTGCVANLTGTFLMNLVHDINKILNIETSKLEDRSHILIGGFNIRLALISIIKHGKTWYEKQGFSLNSVGDLAKKRFLTLETNQVLGFLEKVKNCDVSHLIEMFSGDQKQKLFHKTLRKLFEDDVESALNFDYVFYLPDKCVKQNKVGKILINLPKKIIDHFKKY